MYIVLENDSGLGSEVRFLASLTLREQENKIGLAHI